MRFGRHFLTFRLAAGKRLQLKRDISRKNFYIERIPDGMLCLFIVIVIVVPISGGTSGRTSSLQLNSSISVMSIFRLTCSIASVELNNQTILRSAKAPCIPSNPHVSIWNSIFSKQANRRRKKTSNRSIECWKLFGSNFADANKAISEFITVRAAYVLACWELFMGTRNYG